MNERDSDGFQRRDRPERHGGFQGRERGPDGERNGQREEASRQEGAPRKERVLHTRVSEQLAEDLRQAAEDLRVPVSNLVRNVLEEAFSVVETITDNVGGLIEEVVEEAGRSRFGRRRRHYRSGREERRGEADRVQTDREAPEPPPRFSDVVGWQPLVLNAPRRCAADGRSLERGEQAFVGLAASGITDKYLCRDCVERLP